MAYVDMVTLKRVIVDELAARMPECPVTTRPVPVDYAWPGSDHQKPTHVWMFNARSVSDYASMGAGTKRRDQTWTLTLLIEHYRDGRTVDDTSRNVLQADVDQTVTDIAGIIDDYIATDPKLGQTTTGSVPVDYATFAGFTLEQGERATGASARGTVEITIRLRPK